LALEFVPKSRRSEEICIAAAKQYGKVFKFIPKEHMDACRKALT